MFSGIVGKLDQFSRFWLAATTGRVSLRAGLRAGLRDGLRNGLRDGLRAGHRGPTRIGLRAIPWYRRPCMRQSGACNHRRHDRRLPVGRVAQRLGQRLDIEPALLPPTQRPDDVAHAVRGPEQQRDMTGTKFEPVLAGRDQ